MVTYIIGGVKIAGLVFGLVESHERIEASIPKVRRGNGAAQISVSRVKQIGSRSNRKTEKTLAQSKVKKWIKHQNFGALILEASELYKVPFDLIAAVIETESSGNKFACKYEPNYRYTHNVYAIARLLRTDDITVENMQKTSFGLMQVMGGVFYEHGGHNRNNEDEKWPTAMLDPRIGIEYGVKHLKKMMEVWGNDPATVYAAYNSGSGRIDRKTSMFKHQKKVDRFMRIYREISE